MAGKYIPLTTALREAASRDQQTVDMDFDEIASLVGGLPPTARSTRQWWANNSQTQALAWREAGYHVDAVAFDRGRVRFVSGTVGGSYHDRGRRHPDEQAGGVEATGTAASALVHLPPADRTPVDAPVDVRVVMQWTDAGRVELDGAGKPRFAAVGGGPGLYRLTFTGGRTPDRARVYIGESRNLDRRLNGNYRNPGSRQLTSLRVNALLREHLAAGGTVHVVIATHASIEVRQPAGPPTPRELDLSRKASRLLAENAALVLAQWTDHADIENLP